MQTEPLELMGSLKEQLVTAAEIAAEAYADAAELSFKGYSEDQINDLLIEDLSKGVSRNAIKIATQTFVSRIPEDIPKMTDEAMRKTLIASLQECNRG
jgi:hypothetical protein